MYRIFYASTLVTLTIGTAIGVAALWIPDAYYRLSERMFETDIILFIGSVAGAVISNVGDKYSDTSRPK